MIENKSTILFSEAIANVDKASRLGSPVCLQLGFQRTLEKRENGTSGSARHPVIVCVQYPDSGIQLIQIVSTQCEVLNWNAREAQMLSCSVKLGM